MALVQRLAVLAICAVLGMAGCADEPRSAPARAQQSAGATGASPTPKDTPTSSPTPTSNPAPGVLTGTVAVSSDVAGVPGRTLGPASLLVVPAETVAAFWSSQGFAPSGADAPADFALDAAALPPAVQVVGVGTDGSFSVDVAGPVLLCLADLYGSAKPPVPPRYVQGGCVTSPTDAAAVTLQSEGTTRLVVTARH